MSEQRELQIDESLRALGEPMVPEELYKRYGGGAESSCTAAAEKTSIPRSMIQEARLEGRCNFMPTVIPVVAAAGAGQVSNS